MRRSLLARRRWGYPQRVNLFGTKHRHKRLTDYAACAG